MKIFDYEINNDTILRLNKVYDDLDTVCTDLYHEKENLSYEELCVTQSLLQDLVFSTIQRLRSNDRRISLKSDDTYSTWNSEKDIFDELKKTAKHM